MAFATPSPPVPRVGLCMACASVPGMCFLMSWPVCTQQNLSEEQHVKAGILLSKYRQPRPLMPDRLDLETAHSAHHL